MKNVERLKIMLRVRQRGGNGRACAQHETCGGSGNIATLILNLGNRLRRVFSYSLRQVYLRSRNLRINETWENDICGACEPFRRNENYLQKFV